MTNLIYCAIFTVEEKIVIQQRRFVMNIPLSLLIYNPIEAYTMILLCDIITGNRTKFSIKMINSIYVFGAVNLAIQLVPCLFVGESYFALLNILV